MTATKHKGADYFFAVLMFLMLLGSINYSYGQTLLIDPAGAGGFESGSTFPANGWTVVNGTPSQTNYWMVVQRRRMPGQIVLI